MNHGCITTVLKPRGKLGVETSVLPSKEKIQESTFCRKGMLTIFWDSKGFVKREYNQQFNAASLQHHNVTVTRFAKHDNARPHVAKAHCISPSCISPDVL